MPHGAQLNRFSRDQLRGKRIFGPKDYQLHFGCKNARFAPKLLFMNVSGVKTPFLHPKVDCPVDLPLPGNRLAAWKGLGGRFWRKAAGFWGKMANFADALLTISA